MEIKRILCPTDLSEASAHAVDQAVVVAGYYKSRITALYVLDPIIPTNDGVALDRLRLETGAFFESATKAGIAVDVEVEVGLPVTHILDRASKLPADLIVMGTHGSSGFEHLVLGSVTEKVLRRASGHVLTVPPRVKATSRLPFKRVLCAVDFSDASLAAVKSALSMAEEGGADLTLVHVLEWPWEEPPPPAIQDLPLEQGFALAEFRRYTEESASKRLESLVPATMISSSRVTTRLRSGKPYVQILTVAAEERSDLTLFGSTTNRSSGERPARC